MKNGVKAIVLSASVAVVWIGTTAQAQTGPSLGGADWSGAYAGLQFGFGDLNVSGAGSPNGEGGNFGVHAGYLHDFGTIVIGGEFQYDQSEIESTSLGGTVDSHALLKLRGGYDLGPILPYATIGTSRLDGSDTVLGGTQSGAFLGVGMDYQLPMGLRLGGEVLKHQIDEFSPSGLDADFTTASARVSFQF